MVNLTFLASRPNLRVLRNNQVSPKNTPLFNVAVFLDKRNSTIPPVKTNQPTTIDKE